MAQRASGENVSAHANTRMQVAILPGGRLHLNDGPIDLVIGAEGETSAVRAAYAAAVGRFATVLDELCAELPLLRSEMHAASGRPADVVAQRMDEAVRPLCDARFITRMAAVAGSVADEILAAMRASAVLTRAWVNNGGDIALHLGAGAVFDVGMMGGLRDSRSGRFSGSLRQPPRPHPESLTRNSTPLMLRSAAGASRSMMSSLPLWPSFETLASQAPQDEGSGNSGRYFRSDSEEHREAVRLKGWPQTPIGHHAFASASQDAIPDRLFGTTRIRHGDPVRGVATSGFGGRSFSLGIAEAVTVLAVNAASADAAATLVANAVDLPGHAAIVRAPAHDFDPQSDLGERLVTRQVGPLTGTEIMQALDAGAREAERLRSTGYLVAAALALRGHVRTVGALDYANKQVSHVV